MSSYFTLIFERELAQVASRESFIVFLNGFTSGAVVKIKPTSYDDSLELY